MSISQKLRELLDRQRVKYVVVTHSTAYTAQEIAASMHTPGRELAKTVVVRHRGGLALAVLPAQARVDLERLSSLVGSETKLAGEADFATAFPECELGAMPPFGELYGLKTFVEESLTADREIVFNAGTHTEAIRMAFDDYRRLAQPVVGRFAEQVARAR